MKKIYVAGPIRDPNPIKFLQNIREGIRTAGMLITEGYAPFCPHLDYQYFLQWQSSEYPDLEQIMAVSIEWLRRCDAMFLLPGWRTSDGTMREINFAQLADIPIFSSLTELNNHFKTNHEKEGS